MSKHEATHKFLEALGEMGCLEEFVDRLVPMQDGRTFVVTMEVGDGETVSIPFSMREPPKMPTGMNLGINDEGDYVPWGVESQVPHYSWMRGDRVIAVRELPMRAVEGVQPREKPEDVGGEGQA